MQTDYDVIIIGSGCAGLAAALYTSRAGFRTMILEREIMGGEAMNRQLIENYPGFAEGIQGPDLASAMIEQVMSFGAEIEPVDVSGVEKGDGYFTVKSEDQDRTTKAVIVAGGAIPRKLNVPGEAELTGSGVFYCATCDGPGFAGKPVAIAGAGDSGITEALFLEQLGCTVTVVEFMPIPKASKVLLDRAEANPKITIICNTKITKVLGDSKVTGIEVEDRATGVVSQIPVDGLLVRIGLVPNTTFLKETLELAPSGQVPVDINMQSLIPGLYAAGDVRSNSPMQMATAVGDGVTAAMAAGRYLQVL